MKTLALYPIVMCGMAAALLTPQIDFSKENPPKVLCDAAASKLREGGTSKVALIMTIDTKGRVESFKTEAPKGLRLEKIKEAAAEVRAMTFKPAMKNGSPVRVQIRTEFNCAEAFRSSQGEAAQGTPRGVVGDIPGGLPPETSAPGGILSIEPQSPPDANPARVRVAEKVMRAFLITKVNPSYPSQAEKQHVEGPVLLHINIDKSGNVSKVELVSGHPLLMQAAIDAVKQWKYRPYLLNQKPVEVETTVLIKFVITEGNAYSVIASADSSLRSW